LFITSNKVLFRHHATKKLEEFAEKILKKDEIVSEMKKFTSKLIDNQTLSAANKTSIDFIKQAKRMIIEKQQDKKNIKGQQESRAKEAYATWS